MKYEIKANGSIVNVDFQANGEKLIIQSENDRINFEAIQVQQGVYSVLMNHRSFVVGVCAKGSQRANVNGNPIVLELLDAVHLHLRELGWDTHQEVKEGLISAQIPGLVTKIFFKVGDHVEEGEPLFLIEAMKMENEIKAPISGLIQKISIQEGQTVEKGTNIIDIG